MDNSIKEYSTMSSNMQKAIFVHEIGKPVRLGEREIPSPKAGELLVKVTSVQGM
jgi:D-arabinose 1-dehydrogenase-like Zn-dependent alcohol dehydrogenase